MDSQNEEAVKFFNVEEDEENGHGADGKKRYMDKKGDSLVKRVVGLSPYCHNSRRIVTTYQI